MSPWLQKQVLLDENHKYKNKRMPKITFYKALWFHIVCMLKKKLYEKISTLFSPEKNANQNCNEWTALVVQQVRIRPPTRGTQVQSLIWEDHTCQGAAKPCATTPQAGAPKACASTREATMVRSPCIATKSSPAHRNQRKVRAPQRRPTQPK